MGIGAVVMGSLFILCLIGDEYFISKARELEQENA
jgi:hypothetical protein